MDKENLLLSQPESGLKKIHFVCHSCETSYNTWSPRHGARRPFLLHSKVKGKAVPLQTWTGPEGSRKLRLPDFVTTAQDGGRSKF